MWMTVINLGLFLFSVILSLILRQTIYKIHGKLFGISEDKVAAVVYSFFGTYKIAIIVFNIVPYVALLLINK
jgi:hypothetical protein